MRNIARTLLASSLIFALISVSSIAYAGEFRVDEQTDFDNGTYTSNTEFSGAGVRLTAQGRAMPDLQATNSWFNMSDNILLYHLNESGANSAPSGTDAEDTSSNAIHLSETGSSGNTYGDSGAVNTSINFSAENLESTGNISALLPNSQNFTVCSWARYTGGNKTSRLLGTIDDDTTPGQGFMLSTNSNGDTMEFTVNGQTISDKVTFPTNNFIHWCGSFNNGVITLYRDGFPRQNATGASYTAPTTRFGIGNIGSDSTNYAIANSWIGNVDEVAVFDRSLSANEIFQIYQETSGTIGSYTSQIFDNSSSQSWTKLRWTPNQPASKELINDAADESGYLANNVSMSQNTLLLHLNESTASTTFTNNSGTGANGSCTSPACPTMEVESILNTAANFDGTDDVITATLDGTSANNSHISFWFKTTPGTTPNGIFQWSNALNSSTPFMMIDGTDDSTIRFHVDGAYRTTTNVVPGRWNHIGINLNSGSNWDFFLNGQSVGTYSGGTTNSGNASTIYLGNGENGYFEGSIDEFAVFNRSLGSSEPQTHFERGNRQLSFQVRSCDDALCDTETFIGPDGTTGTFYTESLINSPTTPTPSLSNVSDNQYFQFRMQMETIIDDSTLEISSVIANEDNGQRTITGNVEAGSLYIDEMPDNFSFTAIAAPTATTDQFDNTGGTNNTDLLRVIDLRNSGGWSLQVSATDWAGASNTIDNSKFYIITTPSNGTGNIHNGLLHLSNSSGPVATSNYNGQGLDTNLRSTYETNGANLDNTVTLITALAPGSGHVHGVEAFISHHLRLEAGTTADNYTATVTYTLIDEGA